MVLYTPEDIEIKEIVNIVNALPKVKSLHHVHIWQLNEEETHLEAHIDFNSNITIFEFGEILYTIEGILQEKFKINHVTLQPEYENMDDKDIIVQD